MIHAVLKLFAIYKICRTVKEHTFPWRAPVSALYIKPSFLAKIVLKLFSILSFWTRKVDLQSFTKEWKNWQKCKLDFHVRNTQYKDLPYCFSTLYSKKQ